MLCLYNLTYHVDPYPYAIDEAFDTYRVLVESGMRSFHCVRNLNFVLVGTIIGMSGTRLNIIVSGDSA